MRKGFSLIELLVVIAVIMVLAALLMPTLQGARAKSRSATCWNNLHQIGIAFSTYAAQHDDMIPQALGSADVAAALGDDRALVCPSVEGPGALSYGLNGNVVGANAKLAKIRNVSNVPLGFDARVATGYFYSDLDYRHTGGDANVLYADLHVEPLLKGVPRAYAAASPLPSARPGSGSPLEGGKQYVFSLRIAGAPWESFEVTLYEGVSPLGSAVAHRAGGSPTEQDIVMGPYYLDPSRYTYTLRLSVSALSAGGNPVWLRQAGGSLQQIATLNKSHPIVDVDVTNALTPVD